MRILITGANGLLGQKLVTLITKEQTDQVVATGRGPCHLPAPWNKTPYFQADLTHKKDVLALFEKTRPNFIIHTAAMTQVDQCEKDREACRAINVDAVRYLVESAKSFNTHFIYVSTDFVFDGTSGPYAENDQPNPVNFYGETKLEAERIVQQSGLDFSIIRTVLVYGAAHDMSRSNLILWVKKNLEAGKPIKVVNDQWRTPTLAEDLAAGCYLVCKHKATGIYHISGKEMFTPYQIALNTADFFNLDKSLISSTNASEFIEIGKRPPKTGFNITKAQTDLGFQPHSLADGLKMLSSQMKHKISDQK